MSRAPFELALLNGAHDRTTFNSESASLDRYLREQVTQDVRRRVVACFVAMTDGKRIAGYYGISQPAAGRASRQYREEAATLSDRASGSHGPPGCLIKVSRGKGWVAHCSQMLSAGPPAPRLQPSP